jgi:CopG-like RHH_1 or ribbon-helix-helix domain, RHH_5
MVKRINVTLSDLYYSDLQQWADSRGEPVATFATYMLKIAIDEARRSGEIVKPSSPPPKIGK